MRIAILSPIAWRTPPVHYGPWEKVASLLTEGLVARGHDVTLFATGDSLTHATLHAVCAKGYEEDHTIIPKVFECLHISELFDHAEEFDMIHNHFDFLPLTYTGFTHTPVVTTIHGFSSPNILPVFRKYNKKTFYVSISDADRDPDLDYIRTIHHGIDLKEFDFQPYPEDFLLFLGRFHPDKGAKEAVEIAEMDKAADIGYAMHFTAMKMVKTGIVEQELVGIMEGISISNGTMPSFPIILSQNGETLHNHSHHQILTDGRLLVIDAGAETNMHYASDFTRTLPAGGKFTQMQRDIYTIVSTANNLAIDMIRPGITYREVHLAAGKILAQGLINLGIMKGNADEAVAAGAHALFMPHGLGHQMGLDVVGLPDAVDTVGRHPDRPGHGAHRPPRARLRRRRGPRDDLLHLVRR